MKVIPDFDRLERGSRLFLIYRDQVLLRMGTTQVEYCYQLGPAPIVMDVHEH